MPLSPSQMLTVTAQWKDPKIKDLVQSRGLRLDGDRFRVPSAVLPYLHLPSSALAASQPCSLALKGHPGTA